MENQINVGDQNSQQIGKNSTNKPISIQEKSKVNYLVISIVVLVCFVIFGFGGYYLGKQSFRSSTREMKVQTSPAPAVTETEDLFTDWGTFQSKEYIFKYPNDWQQNDTNLFGSRAVTEFHYQNGTPLSFSVVGNYNQVTGKAYKTLDEYLGKGSEKAVNIQIAGYPAKLVNDPGGEGHVLPFQRAVLFSTDKAEILDFYYQSSYYQQESTQNVLTQILSTFQFTTNSTNTINVELYYHDSRIDPNTDFCEANNYIEKEIPKTNSPIKDSINTLIRSDIFERDDRFILKSINLKQDGTLILEFPWIGGFTTGGSCRIGILTSQIEKTALQFPEVKKVIFEPEVFQP